jgi:anti-sigma regulatory factor (Ser/Thr protein kinase)
MSGREPVPYRTVSEVAVHSVVSTACEAARQFSEAADLSPNNSSRLCVIVEEIVTNALEHGASPFAELSLELDGEGVRIVLIDAGTPFDPRAGLVEPPEARVGGGVGLDLVRGWAKILKYEGTAGSNRLDLLMLLRR